MTPIESAHPIDCETGDEQFGAIKKQIDGNTHALESNTELLRPDSKIMENLKETDHGYFQLDLAYNSPHA